jgi:hypothetical protein
VQPHHLRCLSPYLGSSQKAQLKLARFDRSPVFKSSELTWVCLFKSWSSSQPPLTSLRKKSKNRLFLDPMRRTEAPSKQNVLHDHQSIKGQTFRAPLSRPVTAPERQPQLSRSFLPGLTQSCQELHHVIGRNHSPLPNAVQKLQAPRTYHRNSRYAPHFPSFPLAFWDATRPEVGKRKHRKLQELQRPRKSQPQVFEVPRPLASPMA